MKKLTINTWAIIGLMSMIILSILLPNLQIITKIIALLIYSSINFYQLTQRKKAGENISMHAATATVIILVVAYLLFM